jgi:hypothetical protein
MLLVMVAFTCLGCSCNRGQRLIAMILPLAHLGHWYF